MKVLLLKILDNLRYPTTWQGIVALLTAVGVSVKPELAASITQAGIAVVGALLVLFSDSDVKPKK